MSLSLGHVTTTLYGKTGGKKCVDMVKNLDMERLSWLFGQDRCHHKGGRRSESGKDMTTHTDQREQEI